MFAGKTVFVVGAGASYEADLPTGEGLIPKIADFLSDDTGEIRDLVRYPPNFLAFEDRRQATSMLAAAAKRIAKGIHSSFSIDNFIDENRDDIFIEAVGKLAIAKTIIDAENGSKLHLDGRNVYNEINLSNVRGTWYTKLSSLLFENCRRDELSERFKRITFVIFNYDRCIEHYLFWALRLTYGFTNIEAADVLSNITFHHPYGSVGMLPYFSGSESVPFGDPRQEVNPWVISKGLKTFTEGVESQQHVAIQKAVFDASMVIFLGFAYHSLNMLLLTPTERPLPMFEGSKRYFGTVYGRSKSDRVLLENQVLELCNVTNGTLEAELADVKCAQLFDEYHATFALDGR